MEYKLKILIGGKQLAHYKLKYKAGKLFCYELVSGGLDSFLWHKLNTIIPQDESLVFNKCSDTVIIEKIEKVEKDITYVRFMDLYNTWYIERTGIKPKIDGTSGKALKSIISFLVGLTGSDDEAITTWNAVLTNFDATGTYYASKIELRQINSNLNTILNFLKNGTTNQSIKASFAESLREGI